MFHRGIFHAEGDVVVERVVEENGFLVHVSDECTQVTNGQVFDVDAVDKDFAPVDVVVARYEVDKSGFAGTALPHKSDGAAAWYGEADVAEDVVLAVIAE